jgi:Xaa-Pro aminopeptidase
MKMVGAISNAFFWRVYEHLRPGISECELGAEVAKEWFRWQNLSVFEVSLSSGPNTSPNYIACRPSDRIIEPGDLVYLDLVGPVFSGYRSCCYRVFKCGAKPTQREKDWYQKAYDWLYAGLEYLKPGYTSADIAKQWPKCEIWGNVSEHQASPNCVGHGLGLGQHEYPFIGRICSLDDPLPIEKGMVVALETWHGEYGVGGCRIENVYLVTDDGYELTQGSWPDEEITVPNHSLIIG